MKKKVFLSVTMMATTLAMTMVSCSKDDDVNNGNEIQTDYVWGTDGSIKTCDHLTFTADGKDDANGTIIGNGDKEFVFTGKQTLKKGVYLMKGWIYVADGAEQQRQRATVSLAIGED